MEEKQKRMALLFAMFFIASLSVMLLFNEGVEGQAIKEFDSKKEKSAECTEICDKKMHEETLAYNSWNQCHEECMK